MCASVCAAAKIRKVFKKMQLLCWFNLTSAAHAHRQTVGHSPVPVAAERPVCWAECVWVCVCVCVCMQYLLPRQWGHLAAWCVVFLDRKVDREWRFIRKELCETEKKKHGQSKMPHVSSLINSPHTNNWQVAQTEYKYMIKLTFRGVHRWMTLTDGQFGC